LSPLFAASVSLAGMIGEIFYGSAKVFGTNSAVVSLQANIETFMDRPAMGDFEDVLNICRPFVG